jgi:hypothetical protein
MSELLADDAVVVSCVSEADYRSWQINELLPGPYCFELTLSEDSFVRRY